MELKAYLRILLRRWWIVVPAFLITLSATSALTFREPPIYRSSATYVLKLGSGFQDDKGFVSALDILSRRAEIAATYTEVATSRLIKQQAADALGLSMAQRGDYSVSSRAIGGTNVLEISVEGLDPTLARDFTNAIGSQTIAYVGNLYETYELESLDQASLHMAPISPNYSLNLALGAILGLVLGGGLAFLAEYLRAPVEQPRSFNILDDQTGMYNKRYFLLRLRQELSRARHARAPLVLVLMNVDHHGVMEGASPQFRGEALHQVQQLLTPLLREEDILSRFGDTVLAFLLPDLGGEEARRMIERAQARLAATMIEIDTSDTRLKLHSAAGIVAYQESSADADDLLARATLALEGAEGATYKHVRLIKEAAPRRQAATRRGKTNGARL